MIPKIIHYCWFGGNPLPPLALECIASWRKFFPDYEIWQWGEDGNVNDRLDSFREEEVGAKLSPSALARMWGEADHEAK